MATIDQEGLLEVKKVKDALNHIYKKLESLDLYDNDDKNANSVNVVYIINEEYSFMFKILGQMEDEWNHNVNEVFSVPDDLTINGKNYTSRS